MPSVSGNLVSAGCLNYIYIYIYTHIHIHSFVLCVDLFHGRHHQGVGHDAQHDERLKVVVADDVVDLSGVTLTHTHTHKDDLANSMVINNVSEIIFTNSVSDPVIL